MDKQTHNNLTNISAWQRLIYMVLFAVVGSIARIVVFCIAIFQFLSLLITGRVNRQLVHFGQSLSQYIYQITLFITFNTEGLPFPFSPWPRSNNDTVENTANDGVDRSEATVSDEQSA